MGLVSEIKASLRSCDCSDGTRVADVREEKLSRMMKIFCLSLLITVCQHGKNGLGEEHPYM